MGEEENRVFLYVPTLQNCSNVDLSCQRILGCAVVFIGPKTDKLVLKPIVLCCDYCLCRIAHQQTRFRILFVPTTNI